MDPHILEWLNLFLRWFHVTAAIAWIGSSFYFNWLEGNLDRQKKPDGLAGDLWAVHGGGFYHVLKLSGPPQSMPKLLHWFKYEAYFTWLSGMSLLTLIYFYGADTYLLDAAKSHLGKTEGILLCLFSLVLSWLFYHYLAKSKLSQKPVIFTCILLVFFSSLAFLLTQVFQSKAAYILMGAVIGTIMVANVFFVIIPAQKIMVANAKAKENKPHHDNYLGKWAGQRSLHNNYATLPIIFIMISGHYPATFGYAYQWALLVGLSIAAMGIRHYFNLKNRKEKNAWILPLATIAMLAMAILTKKEPELENKKKTSNATISDIEAMSLFQSRCRTCHNSQPVDPLFTQPPNGVTFDTLEDILARKDDIYKRTITLKDMPLANRSKMTDKEREKIALWLKKER